MKGRNQRRQGGPQETPFRDALLSSMQERGGLGKVADMLVDAGYAGKLPAISQIADRLDGKPMQALEHSAPGGGPPVTRIEHVIVYPDGRAKQN
jgi:hypothetical protein